jgi:hypothetical protein
VRLGGPMALDPIAAQTASALDAHMNAASSVAI